MKTADEIKDIRFPNYTIDPELNKYDNVVLFPDKLAKANAQLKESGFPMVKEKNKPADAETEVVKQRP